MKKTIRNKIIACILVMAAMITTVITVPTETHASTEYTSFTLTSENAYQAGLCERGEEPTGDVVIPATFTYEGTNYKVTNIGSFCDNKNITSVEIPSTVKKINDFAFSGCKNLKSVKMSKMDSIGQLAFANCSSLKEISVNAKTVGDEAFLRCSKLSKVTFGDNVREIKFWALQECNNLKTITIGKNVTKLGQSIDLWCKNVKTITIKSTKLKAKNCGIMGGRNGDVYFAPFDNFSGKETIKVPKSKLKKYKKFLGNGNYHIPIKYKAI